MQRELFAIMLFLVSIRAFGQTPIEIDEANARANIVEHQIPTYPPIARAAHVSGDVILRLSIDVNGHVSQATFVSGPPMLQGAALEAVKQWTFRPFVLNGQPTTVSTKFVIPFTLGEADPHDKKIAALFFPLSDQCHALGATNGDPAEQAKTCRAAAAQADQFSSKARFIERRGAYVSCAAAFMHNHELADARACADKAVTVVAQGHDSVSGLVAAYSTRGQIEDIAGDLPAADKDYGKAEASLRDAINSPTAQELYKSYASALKTLLTWHSRVLNAMGKSDEAAAKLAEAAKYQ
jgi:TonB family protein